MNQTLDQLVANINQGIDEAGELVKAEKVPDFSILDQKITQFAEVLNDMPAEQAKEYAPLLRTWGDEIRKVSDTLGVIKDQVADQLSGANTGSKANSAYGATSNLIKP